MDDFDECYSLPSHPSVFSLDPLGVCDDDNPTAWTVFLASIQSFRETTGSPKNITQLPQLIEDLSYSIHMNGRLDTRHLQRFLAEKYPDPDSPIAQSVLNNIIDASLLLPQCFTTHMIPFLNPRQPILQLSTSQIKSLLAHQILNTLTQPKGNTWGSTFICWFSEPQRLETAVSGYLSSLLDYFTLPLDNATQITYEYYTNPSDGIQPDEELRHWLGFKTGDVSNHLIIDSTSSRTVPFPHEEVSCTLIASNESPGFGTSCTQEELITGACPPLLLIGALLISPPVPADAVLLVYGYVPLFRWQGQGREARPLGSYSMAHHTFLFLDASELDMVSQSSTLADIKPEYLLRDLHKAHTGFMALRRLSIKDVASPLWGAGAFGGDPIVKSLILATTATGEDITVHLSVDKDRPYKSDKKTNFFEGRNTVIEVLREVKEKHTDKTIGDLLGL